MSLDEVIALATAGRLRDARERAAQLATALPAPAHPFRDQRALDDAAIHHEHGALAWATARFDEAAAALDKAYKLRAASLGDDHPLTLATVQRQAALAGYRDQRTDAAALFARAIDGLEAALGARDVEPAIARRNHAAFLRDSGDHHAARAELDRAIPVIERRCGKEHPSYAAALKVDAMVTHYEGVEWRALRQAERAVDACRRCHAEHHPYTAAAHLIAAKAEHQLGRMREAGAHAELAITDLEAAYGDHPLVAIALLCGSQIDYSTDDVARAERRARRALVVYQQHYTNRWIVGFAEHLWGLLEHQGKWLEAATVAELVARSETEDDELRVSYIGAACTDYYRAGTGALAREKLAQLIALVGDPAARTWLEGMVAAIPSTMPDPPE